jgi:methionine-rich copper-binding protein CopC
MKRLLTFLFSICLVILGTQTAHAHAQLNSSVPAKNQTVKVLPNLVWLEFDGDLLSFGGYEINRISVTDSKKLRVDIGGSIVGGARISTKLKPGLPPGKYSVTYRIVSEDGHPVEGSFFFTYKPK